MEEGPAKPGATFTALMCVCHAVLQMLLCVIPPTGSMNHLSHGTGPNVCVWGGVWGEKLRTHLVVSVDLEPLQLLSSGFLKYVKKPNEVLCAGRNNERHRSPERKCAQSAPLMKCF